MKLISNREIQILIENWASLMSRFSTETFILVHYLQQKCVKNQIWSQKEQWIQIQRELHYENGFCSDVFFVISVFLSFTNWSSTVTTTTWENNPQWNISQCALFLWNRFVTLYARLVDFLSSVLLFSKTAHAVPSYLSLGPQFSKNS